MRIWWGITLLLSYVVQVAAQHSIGYVDANDITTGRVTDVSVLKSTGYGVLDGSAIRTLKLWRWKPGRSRQVNVPISFKLDPRWANKPFPGASPLPRSRY